MKDLIKKLLREHLKIKKTIYLIHGYEGSPNNHWFPWLKNELEKKGSCVKSLKMPSPNTPKLNDWVDYMQKKIINPDKNVYLIGHSLGCLAIIHFLNTLPENTKIGKCIFVAGFKELKDKNMTEFYLDEINYKKIKTKCNDFTCIYSENDSDVSIKQSEIFANDLNATKIINKSYGHFTSDDGITKLEIVLEII